MIPLTRPVIGMMVFDNYTSHWYKVTNILHSPHHSIFIWVLDLDTYEDFGWYSLTHFFVEENKNNWLKEGF